jgi:hypothetical protein
VSTDPNPVVLPRCLFVLTCDLSATRRRGNGVCCCGAPP